jgi:hypothetical protein
VLKAVSHNLPRTAADQLNEFITSHSDGDAPAPAPPQVQAPEKQAEKSKTVRPVLIVIAVLALVIAAVTVYYGYIRTGPSGAVPLPSLASLEDSSISLSPHMRKSKSPEFGEDGPAPVTGTATDLTSGSIIITGITRKDTIFANNRRMTPVTKGNKFLLKIKPGQYSLEIRRAGGKVFTRDAAVMPYQKIVWNLKEQ